MPKKSKDIGYGSVQIIGAGPAGLSAAYALSKEGKRVQVYESSPVVGGMCRSIDLFDQRVDLGPHRFFSSNARVNKLFDEVLEEDYEWIDRLTRIYFDEKFFNYPLKLSNVLRNLSPLTVAQVITDYFHQKLQNNPEPQTFEDWVVQRFGKKLYTLFFENYTYKLWGIPGSRIDADWAAQRIKKLSLGEAVISALRRNSGNKHKTLVDRFKYPITGTGQLYESMSQEIRGAGGKIHLDCPVETVCIEKSKYVGVRLKNGDFKAGRHCISSMPITLLVKNLPHVPEEVEQAISQLYFRNTILVYLELQGHDYFPDNWIYVHSPKVKHGRITNFRNWSKGLHQNNPNTILCLEYWAFEDEELWKAEDDILVDQAFKELKKLNLIKNKEPKLRSKVVKIPKCYPVYEKGYQKNIKIIRDFLNTIEGLHLVGRYGSFKYNNQDHSIEMGLTAADIILGRSSASLWDINSDDVYQEEGKAVETLHQ